MRLLVGVVAALLTLSGCSQISAQLKDQQVSSPVTTVANTGPVLVTQQWGVVDGMLSVVVTNSSHRTLRHAEAVITARDDHDVLVASSTNSPNGTCCAVLDLPPGERFGFYFDVGSSAAAIGHVDVAYRDVAWAAASRGTKTTFRARATRLDANAVGAVVVAHVTGQWDPVAQVAAQAFLTDRNGDFIAVVSGRWYCFTDGDREIRMQLFHPVPDGTRVEAVVVHPVVIDPARRTPTCPAGKR